MGNVCGPDKSYATQVNVLMEAGKLSAAEADAKKKAYKNLEGEAKETEEKAMKKMYDEHQKASNWSIDPDKGENGNPSSNQASSNGAAVAKK